MTIRDYVNDGDAQALAGIKLEYDYLIGQKFELMDQRDSLLELRRSVVDVTRQLGDMTGRLRFLDDRRQTISRIPCINYAYGINPKDTRRARVWDPKDFRDSGIKEQFVERPKRKLTKFAKGGRLVEVTI